MDANTVSILIAITGCFVGLAGWLSKRDDKIVNDSEWKGTINAKLDYIVATNNEVPLMKERITQVEESSKQAHKRIDELKSK